jgi:hypothetical protein
MNQGILLSETIKWLVPNAEFVIRGEDLTGLEWISQDIEQPSDQTILDAVDDYQNWVQQKKEQAEAKREAALAKLAALGLEPDDLKALGL